MKEGYAIHWNGPPVDITPQDSCLACVEFWQAVKDYHMDTRGWSDIAYSFGVCQHGNIHTGRGWHKNQFANGTDNKGSGNGGDNLWYSILAFIGEGQRPTPHMITGISAVIATGRAVGFAGYRIRPHSDWKYKPCPGPDLTGYCEEYDGRNLPAANVPTIIPEEHDMRIIDCQGKPALLVAGQRYQRIDSATRGAFASAGVPAGQVTTTQYDLIVTALTRFAT